MQLPIDPLIPEIVAHLGREPNLVIEAPPGAGKTTRVPPALLAALHGDVLVLEPRRIAARLAARRVASELGEAPGETVGYQVRFEDVSGPRTRLRFLTEGVLVRRLLSDACLQRVSAVILDEFHERHLEGDLALALLRRLQSGARSDLRLVVMSATLAATPVAHYLGDCRVLRSEGRQYPLAIEYTPHSAAKLEEQVATAIERIVGAGHVLVFLPGAEEIRRAMRACEGIAQRKDLQIVPLHGDLSAEEQDRAVAGSARPKVILSTNVAESSITIEGVTAVVDSGLARIASYSAWSGLPTLQVTRVSQASANQRAGRAGRTGAGRVIRLYSADDFARRPAHDTPEITRADLSPAALALRAMQVESFGALEWLQPPPPKNIAHAEQLLRDLHAVDASGRLTEIGSEMAGYPLHPRLARLVIEARRRGVAEDGCAVAAVLSAGERLPSAPPHRSRSDLLVLLEGDCERRTGHVLRQIRRIVNPPRQGRPDDDALLLSILSAYPDRVARRRSGQELLLASGGSAVLSNASTVDAEFLVAIEIEDRRDQRLPLVRLASAVDPEWLLELFPERIRENQEVQWHRTGERVEAVSALYFDQIVLEDRRSAPDPRSAAAMLAAKAMEAGIARFTDADAIDAWLARVAFAAAHAGFEPLGEAHVRAAVESLSSNLHSFSELSKVCESGGLLRALEDQSPAGGARMLDEIAPAHIRLPGGRQVRVHYEAGKAPWIASRLQDFFGMRETPRVARGRIPVVVHLLAPNQRPVQTTTDLAGFWERLYPQVRRELSRRYPKHSWPEDPNRVVHREAK